MNFLKKIWAYLLLYKKILNGLGVLFLISILYLGYHLHNQKIEKKIDNEVYKIVETGSIFDFKGPKLDEVDAMVVINPEALSFRDILIKNKNEDSVLVFKGITREQFELYSISVLSPRIKENSDFKLYYSLSYEPVGRYLGLKTPSTIVDPGREIEQSAWDVVRVFLPMFMMMAFLVYFLNRNTTTRIDEVLPANINDNLSDLVGLDDIKMELLQIKDMYENRQLYRSYNVDKPFNIFMSGPAGVGKTKIARCLAKELNIPLIYGSAAGLQSGYVGGGTRALKAMVKVASKHNRAIIFLDEGESLFKSRLDGRLENYESETINSFLSILDGVNTTDSNIIWMVASNMDEYKISMDAAMLRRFPLKINFRLPNFETRKAILNLLVSKLDDGVIEGDIDVGQLAGITAGFSPAQLETMIDRASRIAIIDKIKLSQSVLLSAFERVAIGLTDRDTTANLSEMRRIVACHEVGHFLTKVHFAITKSNGDLENLKQYIDVIKISTESVSKMAALGFVLSREKELRLETLNEYEEQIIQLYGGMANEEIYYTSAGTTAGAHNDIEKVSSMLKTMITEIGFYQPFKLNLKTINNNNEIPEKQLSLIEQKSTELYGESIQILKDLRPLSDLLIEVLMEKYVLEIDEALKIVVNHFTPKNGADDVALAV